MYMRECIILDMRRGAHPIYMHCTSLRTCALLGRIVNNAPWMCLHVNDTTRLQLAHARHVHTYVRTRAHARPCVNSKALGCKLERQYSDLNPTNKNSTLTAIVRSKNERLHMRADVRSCNLLACFHHLPTCCHHLPTKQFFKQVMGALKGNIFAAA